MLCVKYTEFRKNSFTASYHDRYLINTRDWARLIEFWRIEIRINRRIKICSRRTGYLIIKK